MKICQQEGAGVQVAEAAGCLQAEVLQEEADGRDEAQGDLHRG